MINRVYAYVLLNIKSLLKDKISFLWSIFLPAVMLFINKNLIQKEQDLGYWWVYMLICSYLYGVGLYALELRESGCLRVIFSINHSSIEFFFGNLLTQIIFSFVSISLFNCMVLLVKPFSIVKVWGYSIQYIFACIPLAFLGYGFTLLKKIHANSLRTIISILVFGMFMLMNIESDINKYNPICFIAYILYNPSLENVFKYIVFLCICMSIGIAGIYCFEPNSMERR